MDVGISLDATDHEVAQVMGKGGHNNTIDMRRSSQPQLNDRNVNTTMAIDSNTSGIASNNRYNPRRVDRSMDNNLYMNDIAHKMDHA
jgi:hypothetical protein